MKEEDVVNSAGYARPRHLIKGFIDVVGELEQFQCSGEGRGQCVRDGEMKKKKIQWMYTLFREEEETLATEGEPWMSEKCLWWMRLKHVSILMMRAGERDKLKTV